MALEPGAAKIIPPDHDTFIVKEIDGPRYDAPVSTHLWQKPQLRADRLCRQNRRRTGHPLPARQQRRPSHLGNPRTLPGTPASQIIGAAGRRHAATHYADVRRGNPPGHCQRRTHHSMPQPSLQRHTAPSRHSGLRRNPASQSSTTVMETAIIDSGLRRNEGCYGNDVEFDDTL